MEGKETSESAEQDRSTESLIPQVYDDLRRLAKYRMEMLGSGQTISGTVLVHEAYLRLSAESDVPKWKNERQFFSAAAEAMRRIIIDRIRAKHRIKRGENPEKVELQEDLIATEHEDNELLGINEALDELEAVDSEAAELVKLRFFVGLTIEEISQSTGLSPRTLNRQWAYARAWLAERLSND